MKRILTCSGKGGVGKTVVSVCLARELRKSGFKVGILDVDIDTPNVTEFMLVEDKEIKLSETGMNPKIVEDDIEMMSVGLMVDSDTAIMWDGNRRAMVIDQLMKKVDWNCDVLVIDSPPGTTDEVMTVIRNFEPDGIVVVTTNHRASISDVRRTLKMISLLGADEKVIGVIKNMTHIVCECGRKIKLFDSDDDDIDSLVVAEIPYTNDYKIVASSLAPVVEKIIERL